MRSLRVAAVTVICAGAVACVGLANQEPTSWYGSQDAVQPKDRRVVICHAFGCARRTGFTFSEQDMARIRSILARGKVSATAERRAFGNLVQWFERRVGPIAGSSNDEGGFDIQNAGIPGQMDCIDEATNTTSLLLVAQKYDLLNHHRVGRPVARGFLIDGRYPHATATVIDTGTGAAYAVDSWPRDNGEPPNIMPLERWAAERQAT